MSKTKKTYLAIILFLALFLRLWNITKVPVSLFGDELDVGYHAYSIIETARDYQGNFMPVDFHSMAEWRTPLFLYAAVPTVALFGITPLGVRLPAVIFAVAGILAMYLLTRKISRTGKHRSFKIGSVELQLEDIVAFVMAIAPWHIQYSRAAFEVTMLLAFLLFGIYYFLESLDTKGRGLWISVTLLTFTPWIYNTAKLFTPLLMLTLFIIWRKEILSIPVKQKKLSILAGLVVGIPILASLAFGGGTQRAGFTSVFTDNATIREIGEQRMQDAHYNGEPIINTGNNFWDRFYF